MALDLQCIYDWIVNCNKNCIYNIDYLAFKNMKNILVISVIEEARFKEFMENLRIVNPEAKIIIVVQDYVFEAFQQQYGTNNQIIKWHGKYTEKLLDEVAHITDIQLIDGFVFFSDMEGNLRDSNFLNLALKMPSKMRVVNWTIGNELFEYKNIPLYLKTIEVYSNINELIELEED